MNRDRIIKIASITSVLGNAMLAVMKIAVGIIAGSLSVLGDGMDSLADVFISLITLAISIIIVKPPDKEHPYGHYRAETIATSVLAFIIFFIGGQLAVSTAGKLLHHEPNLVPEMMSVYVTVFSIVGKLILSWSQYKLGRKAGSQMIIANGRNMLNDIVTSISVLIGLACVYFFNAPIIDKILAIIIGVWIMISAVRIFRGTVTELMEGETDIVLYNKVFEEARKIDGISNPHRVRIRKIGVYYLIEMDVEVDGDARVKDAHTKVKLLEKRMRESIPYIYDIVIHVEPLGNVEEQECWGLNEKNTC
ncbi:MAG: cation transporter [Spirochaetes bacterium]|nr:cation transporter [Spirochaetota bacterium]